MVIFFFRSVWFLKLIGDTACFGILLFIAKQYYTILIYHSYVYPFPGWWTLCHSEIIMNSVISNVCMQIPMWTCALLFLCRFLRGLLEYVLSLWFNLWRNFQIIFYQSSCTGFLHFQMPFNMTRPNNETKPGNWLFTISFENSVYLTSKCVHIPMPRESKPGKAPL